MAKTGIKQIIVEAFIEQVESTSLRSVQVAKLIKDLGINRNTFYYHFSSKYDVALFIFRTDLAHFLQNEFQENELVLAPLSPHKGALTVPYYTHREIGAHTLDFGDFFKQLVRCVLARPAFYKKVFDGKEQEFRLLFEDLYRTAVQKDLLFILGGRYLPQSTFHLFLNTYTSLIYEIAAYSLKHSNDAIEMLEESINPFWNLPYETLVHGLRSHPVIRKQPSR